MGGHVFKHCFKSPTVYKLLGQVVSQFMDTMLCKMGQVIKHELPFKNIPEVQVLH